MLVRCTPALATASALTTILVLWFTVDVANSTTAPSVFSNALTMATVASWLHWAGGQRRDRAVRNSAADATVRQLR